ncbi:MAG: hypothetical protein PHQ90_12305, partial [Sulfuricurvum sp.]|nr:hypothetical protein [Sulfuricurvum sp.]
MKSSANSLETSKGFIVHPSPKPISYRLMLTLSMMVVIFTVGVGALFVQQHYHLLEDRVTIQVNGL